jgi:hypothetical protein
MSTAVSATWSTRISVLYPDQRDGHVQGSRFTFTQHQFDLLDSDLNEYP